MVDRYHHYMFDVFQYYTIGLPFSALLPNKCVLYQRLKKRIQTLHHVVLVVVLLILLTVHLDLRLFVKSNNDGTPHVGYYSVCLWQSDTE